MAPGEIRRFIRWVREEAAPIAVVLSAISLTVSLIGIFSYGPSVARELSDAQIKAAQETADEVARLQIEAASATADEVARLQIEAAEKSAAATAEMQIEATREIMSQTAETHAEAIRTAPPPAVILTRNTKATVPEESCPGGGSTENCNYLSITLSSFPEAEFYRYQCWSTHSGLFDFGEMESESASTICPFTEVGDEVWAIVNGHMSTRLTWKALVRDGDEPVPLPDQSVLLSIGDSAIGERDCETDECNYLDITLENFSGAEHTLDCLFSPSGSQSTVHLLPRQQIAGDESTRDCWYDGREGVVWVVVDNVASDNIEVGLTASSDSGIIVIPAPEETPATVAPDLTPSWHGETWIALSWYPPERDPVGDQGVPEEHEVRYRLSADDGWTTSASTTSYHNGSNRYVYQYYHRIEGLTPFRNYEAEVRQCNDSGCSEWSSYLFRTEKPIPPAPTSIRIVEIGRDKFILEWDPVPGAYTYDVYYVGGGSITSGGSHSAGYETVFTLAPDAEYVITVNSCNDLQRHGDYGSEACGELEDGTVLTLRTLP